MLYFHFNSYSWDSTCQQSFVRWTIEREKTYIDNLVTDIKTLD